MGAKKASASCYYKDTHAPAQFGTHCVPNRETLEESSHVTQVALIKPTPEFGCQRFRQSSNQASPIRCTVGALLLEFHDVSPDFPTGTHLYAYPPPAGLAGARIESGRATGLGGWAD